MTTAAEHFQAGELTAAIAEAGRRVKSHPNDTSARGLLCELLCFAGELDRADAQLDVLNQQDPRSAMGIAIFRQLLRAERARQEFHQQGRVPEFLQEPTEAVRLRLEASIRLREGAAAEASELLEVAEASRVHVSGTCNGEAFDDLRDLDDLSASVFEVLTTTGKYYWIPIESVQVVEFRPPKRPRDLLWRACHMVVQDGPDGEVYMAAIYPGSHTSKDDRLRLGRVTEWQGGDGKPTRGAGLRTFLVGDGTSTIMELGQIELRVAASKGA